MCYEKQKNHRWMPAYYFKIFAILFAISLLNMVICSYALRAYMKTHFSYTYRYVAEPFFKAFRKLETEMKISTENGNSSGRHRKMYRYVIYSLIFSPPVLIVLLLLFTALSN